VGANHYEARRIMTDPRGAATGALGDEPTDAAPELAYTQHALNSARLPFSFPAGP
jgi:hypothetical protein